MNAVAIAAEIGKDLARVVVFLHKLAVGGYFGTVTLKFEAGRVSLVKTEQTIKPDELESVRVVR